MTAARRLPQQQRCAVWLGDGELRVEERTVPELGPADVLIEVALCGVCGTDVHTLAGKYPIFRPPKVLGHEYAGVVRAVGGAVTSVAAGDRVTVEPGLSCGTCFYCREGSELMCPQRVSPPGAFAEYTVVPERSVFTLPNGVSLEAGALSEPLSCALHAVTLAGVRPGDRVAIVGAGAIGLMLLQLARRAGASRVLVSDPMADRRAMATRLGATLAVDPTTADVHAAARDLTQGIGVDIAIEAVGARAAVLDCLALPRRGGTAVLMGVAAPSLEVPLRPYDVYQRQLTIKGSFIRAYNFARTVRLPADLELEALITHEYTLSEAAAAVRHVAAGRGIKTIVRPDRAQP